MSDSRGGRTAKCLGEARDLATFLQVVDGWASITPALGLTIQLFRGQEDESWLLKPGIARPQYVSRVTPDTEARMLAEFKHRAIPHLESTLGLADADWLAIAQHHAMSTRLLDWSESGCDFALYNWYVNLATTRELDQSVRRTEILGQFMLPVMPDLAEDSQTCPHLEWG